MKKTLAFILSLVFALGMCCVQAEEPTPLKTGLLTFSSATEDEFEKMLADHVMAHQQRPFDLSLTYYDNLTSLLMGLRAKDVEVIITSKCVADYMVASNPSLHILPAEMCQGTDVNEAAYKMMLREESTELQALLNKAITELKAEGVIDALIEKSIQGCVAVEEPQEVALPVIEGAPTITVAVTGDLPPMDYVSVAGAPAGFNIELLSKISEKANINIKIMTVDTGARITALSSGRADVVFWSCTNYCPDHPDYAPDVDLPAGTIVTESYFVDGIHFVYYK